MALPVEAACTPQALTPGSLCVWASTQHRPATGGMEQMLLTESPGSRGPGDQWSGSSFCFRCVPLDKSSNTCRSSLLSSGQWKRAGCDLGSSASLFSVIAKLVRSDSKQSGLKTGDRVGISHE